MSSILRFLYSVKMAAWLKGFPPWIKIMLICGTGLLVGMTTYGVLTYLEFKKSKFKDEGFEDISKVEDTIEKRILVLGLDGVGKSSFLANLSRVENDQLQIKPTEGFNVMCVHTQGAVINLWEIGGAEKVRSYWSNFFQDTDVLVFVVDSADTKRLPLVYDEFQKLLVDDRLKNVPFLVLANKQDLPEALTPKEIEDALNIKNISPKQRQIGVKGLQIMQIKPHHPSLREAEDLMIKLAFDN